MNRRNHVHSWVMTSPHPFGRVLRYKCTSCPATKQEPRLDLTTQWPNRYNEWGT